MNLRLNTLAEMVDPGARIADIGTDHAYLPILLVKNNKINYAIASDIGKGPLENAKADIKEAGLEEKIDTRLGAGLVTVKKEDNVDTVVIAGMGGKLMSDILNDDWLKGFHFDTLVLEPNVGEAGVRSWLMIHGYEIVEEHLIAEAGHTYELIKAKLVNKVLPLTEKQLFFGPFILKEKNQVFKEKWAGQLVYHEKLLKNLNKAKKKDIERIHHIEFENKMIKEELDD
ncbi:class I SAM-dependent methyltransferase [Lactobacillus hamsteri]|uniref:S-adenosyl-L-methionine-dependent methyltransferase n=1 Tax=Lactobacillus hamsteri DSM 5661 = JCM 6256 TaxID=1423754 RepID=A0A0R1Y6H5_9LACO|nr:class I SAM-dependent methyltransferase [Lactobacillus hamsteri]KRM38040.1 S-adenosyl-L-methionine-dependent methyltransferase [Lactobacillus hamsteri DSM 5661 = JCM 6256]